MLSLLLASTISAKSSDEFINQLAETICEDCQGENIKINQSITYIPTNYTFNSIEWPYDKNLIKAIIKYLDTENYSFITGTCDNKRMYTDGVDGCGILKCDYKRLDINGDTYYWNGTKVDFLKEEYKINGSYNALIKGDSNQVTTGNYNKMSQIKGDNNNVAQKEDNILLQLFWSKGTIGGILIVFILDILYLLIKRKYENSDKKCK